ncbi:inorganic phosphate transporter [Kamptonema sp. UHCC 0994]|uniref:inorganic phosphate transporter n=1 Tax=Kamptonema sp. UHCC 0994 TaxID=3031329 RepID=UPI0023BA31CA|nr:inorganic phosphate transporter [Kamptonema sp. UHCC 0994]MDF0552975.1 inorganic phosphate transporter [Kamptonema sp. UHCC 0994]
MLDVSWANFFQLGAIALLALYLAANLGANDVANSMGTSVGSKALTLRQAIIIAGILEFTGAVFFGQGVSETLATGVINSAAFVSMPQVFLIGMVSVLVSCGLWLQIATSWGLPVSSSHAVVGAIAGFSSVAAGVGAVHWQTIGIISLTWLVTPVVSGAIAALFYSLVKRGILDRPDPLRQLQEWIPWLSAALLGIFGVIVLPTLSIPLQKIVSEQLGWNLPTHDIAIFLGAIATFSLTTISWQQLGRGEGERGSGGVGEMEDGNLSSAPLPLCSPSPLPNSLIERQMGRFQVLSACFVAFAHGSNDVGNAVAPLAAIAYIRRTGSIPLNDFNVPLWILALGGIGIVTGLAIWGKKVIATVGEGIIELQPSGGFCAELATATTVLISSRLGLPVSTSHALVGAVVGVGLVRSWKSVKFQTLQSIGLAWVITIPIATALAAGIFSLTRLFLGI